MHTDVGSNQIITNLSFLLFFSVISFFLNDKFIFYTKLFCKYLSFYNLRSITTHQSFPIYRYDSIPQAKEIPFGFILSHEVPGSGPNLDIVLENSTRKGNTSAFKTGKSPNCRKINRENSTAKTN